MKLNKLTFTLLELLIVITILGILMTILMPSLNKARKASEITVCLSNQRQVYVGIASQASQNSNKILTPPNSGDGNPKPWTSYVAGGNNFPNNPTHVGQLYTENYITDHGVFYCASSRGLRDYKNYTNAQGYWTASGGKVRASFNINSLRFKKFGDLNHHIKTGVFSNTIPANTFKTSADHAPFIYDKIASGIFHDYKWTITNLDASGKAYQSKALYSELLAGGTEFNGNWSNHSRALYILMGDN